MHRDDRFGDLDTNNDGRLIRLGVPELNEERRSRKEAAAAGVDSDAGNNEGPETPPGGGRVGGSGPI